ncbi:taurine dioxygenase [Nocardioides scoriae]|uniref:Taurine dioxygenase n=1 Tax=Nocardioides scoriae TaxID=642780 RepID=A0A1H1V4T7_9ACTN|nr:TauD/TfdA family dioxygenase [Nocardioides scoriae]SDS79758.1 taurine dioxygenase [Nocardioides scoriae]
MQLNPTTPVGAVVTDLDLADVTPASAEEVKDLLAEHGVLVFPGQEVDDAAFLEFLRCFGDLAFTVGETPVDGFPDLNVISNVGRTTPPRSQFHVDSSYMRVPPAYTALRTVEIPAQGGETLFTNQYAAFEALPDDLVERLDGRTVTHVVTGLDLDEDEETQAEHPLFRPHPRSGRTALYLSTPARCVAISGMDDDEAASTIATLLEHSTRPENTLRHAWAPGDVVMWDNGAVLHRADHSDVVGDRVMHRGMVSGAAASGADTGVAHPGSDHPGW